MSRPHLHVLLSSLVLCFSYFRATYGRFYVVHRFSRHQELQHSVCPQQDVILTRTLGSAIHCSALCTRINICRTSTYNKELSDCVLCRERYSSPGDLVNADGFRLYSDQTRNYHLGCLGESCNENNNICEETLNICVCTPGYSYNPGTMTCDEGCATYGTTYEKYSQYYLEGLNNEKLDNLSLEDCERICSNAAYGCRSFDREGNSCWFSSATALTHPTQYRAWTQSVADFYHRNCAE